MIENRLLSAIGILSIDEYLTKLSASDSIQFSSPRAKMLSKHCESKRI
jgi:hypothetical protein